MKLLAKDNQFYVCVMSLSERLYMFKCSCILLLLCIYIYIYDMYKRDQVNMKCSKVYVTECGRWLLEPAQSFQLSFQQVNWTWSVQTILQKYIYTHSTYVLIYIYSLQWAQYHDRKIPRLNLFECISRHICLGVLIGLVLNFKFFVSFFSF